MLRTLLLVQRGISTTIWRMCSFSLVYRGDVVPGGNWTAVLLNVEPLVQVIHLADHSHGILGHCSCRDSGLDLTMQIQRHCGILVPGYLGDLGGRVKSTIRYPRYA